jgi:Uma2 family endonuclease
LRAESPADKLGCRPYKNAVIEGEVMGNPLKRTQLGETDYLHGEETAKQKSEFVDGEIYAMTGGSARHNRISINLTVNLDVATRSTPCEVFMADMKVKVEAHRAFYYPDVILSCPEGDEHPLYRSAPCLLAEVLSPGTAKIDEREKWLHYRDIPSLKYYLLIDSETRHARVLIRDSDGGWLEQTLDEDDIVAIECDGVKTSICLDDLYERTGL